MEELNEQQKVAVETTEGPVLVLAGAGSGKTKVLTNRIVYLIEKKRINEENILAITFTNKASQEMKERVFRKLNRNIDNMKISTFHSFGLGIIKKYYKELKYEKNFTIIDSEDTLTIIKKIIKDINKTEEEIKPREIKNTISRLKNNMVSPEEYYRNVSINSIEEIIYTIYKRYQDKLLFNNSLDFDDLLLLPIILFKKYPEILEKYQEQYQYIMIDEYQDTNHIQYLLVKMISAKYKNIFVVGDESQSIYSFRGANYKNILNFEHDYKNCKTILLEENYRSTKKILDSANNVIKHNNERKEKNLWTQNDIGNNINVYKALNEKEEAQYAVKVIKELANHGVKKEKIVILYRANAQSRNIEEALLKENIPYKVVGSFYFYNRKEIKDLIAYLKLIYNKKDDTSLLRIINVPKRGIGIKTIENIERIAKEKKISYFDAIASGKELEFKNMIEEIEKEKETKTLTELIDMILEKTKMTKNLEEENNLDSEIRIENLNEFKSITKNFENEKGICSLEDFLEEISLVSDIAEYKDNKDVVTLMTIHAAKGLEFDNVILVGMEENIFPHRNSLTTTHEIEEERRLCYVAITRAKKELWLVNTEKRLIYGKENISIDSRFIKEIGNENLNIIKNEQRITPKTYAETEKENINENIEYSVGDKVKNNLFGTGIIIKITDTLLTIAFPHPHGVKTMMKGHKTIEKI